MVVVAAVAAAAVVVVVVHAAAVRVAVVEVAVARIVSPACPSCRQSLAKVGLNFFGTIQHDSTASHNAREGHSSSVGRGSLPPPNT